MASEDVEAARVMALFICEGNILALPCKSSGQQKCLRDFNRRRRLMYPLVLRQRAVFHYNNFPSTLRQSARIFGIGKSTLARWTKPNHGCLNRRRVRLDAVKDTIEKAIEINPFLTIHELCNLVKQMVKSTAMRRYIRKLGFTRKRCRSKHLPSLHVDYTNKRAELLHALESGNEVISIDETSMYLTKPPGYGYSRRGERLVVQHDTPIRANRVSMVLAISNVRGVVGYSVKQGSFNTESFTDFIYNIDAPFGSVLLMDNVRFHHSGETKSAISMKGLNVLYTPPYSPELNPVEYSFSLLKNEHARRGKDLEVSLHVITVNKVKSFFSHDN